MAWLKNGNTHIQSSTKQKRYQLVERPQVVKDALQQLTTATREGQTYAALMKAAMFGAVAWKSGQGPKKLMGARVGNQPVSHIGTREPRYYMTAWLY